MTTIYKYVLEIEDEQIINVPKFSKTLSVQVQNGKPCVWFMVDDNYPKEERTVKIFGTGNEIPQGQLPNEYIGTFQLNSFVGHVFLTF